MAERISYGKTWWGQRWLNALTQIHEESRLPRGKTYANKGAVQGLKIDTNQISASVKGTKPRPYKVKLTVPLLTSAEKEALLTELSNNPAVLAQLLNRQLPEELVQFAKPVEQPVRQIHECPACLSRYDAQYSEPHRGIVPGTAFEQLSAAYTCGVCDSDKATFIEKWLT